MDLEKMTTKELKKEAKELDYMIYKIECYGTSDIRLLWAIEKELDKRKVKMKVKPNYNESEAYYMLSGDTTIATGFLKEDQVLAKMIKRNVSYEKLLAYCSENW